jgi:2-polyprenyl-3-methyl-5-hydroxy-6-metoxy-1,4-benzoquinol methylase
MPELLSRAGAEEYWDERHRSGTELLSGGDMTYDDAANEAFYAVRLGRLLDVVGHQSSVIAPLRILDAGCGKGYFSRALSRVGHRVDGIDASAVAIEHCRRLAGGPSYAESSLTAWTSSELYDLVIAIDVLFHVLDDEEWEASLGNLAALTRLGGRVVVSDWDDVDRDQQFGTYMLARARNRYERHFPARGLRYDGFTPYRFRVSRIGLHCATRVS